MARSFALTSVPGGLSIRDAAAGDSKKESAGTVEGRLKSLNKRKKSSLAHFHREKTKTQWTKDGVFIGVRKPTVV